MSTRLSLFQKSEQQARDADPKVLQQINCPVWFSHGVSDPLIYVMQRIYPETKEFQKIKLLSNSVTSIKSLTIIKGIPIVIKTKRLCCYQKSSDEAIV